MNNKRSLKEFNGPAPNKVDVFNAFVEPLIRRVYRGEMTFEDFEVAVRTRYHELKNQNKRLKPAFD